MNIPNDFVNRIKKQLGDEANAFLDSYENDYVKSLRVNMRKNPQGIIPAADGKICIPDEVRVPWETRGIYYCEADEDRKECVKLSTPGKSPLHSAGAYYIQEASAMLPVTLLNISGNNERPLKVLDMCASPGGKSTQIADYMNGRGLLVSNEIVGSRAKILSENIERMGVTNAVVISEDPIKLAPRLPHFFDRILVDAPCSGEGMFRKHPEAMNEWSMDNVRMCAQRQAYILDCAASMLDFNGRIVYSTCTFSAEEDEKTIDDFLERHPEFVRAKDDERLYPHKMRGEGHFAAVLEYKDSRSLESSAKQKKMKKSIDREALKLLTEFVTKNMNSCRVLGLTGGDTKNAELKDEVKERLLMFGDKLYLTPEYMIDMSALTVLRPGLHLGNIVKGRFEPAHAFAMALSKDEFTNVADFSYESQSIKDYLKGMTLNHEAENGWCLVCTEGISTGWAKSVNNILKNHYPKGLRTMG